MQRLFLIIVACLALVVAGCGDDSSTSDTGGGTDTSAEAQSPKAEEEAEVAEEEKAAKEAEVEAKEEEEKVAKEVAALPKPKVPSGPPPKELVITDKKTGSGTTAKAGDQVTVHYVGILYTTKELFDANWSKEQEPFSFKLGANEVIKGWDQGVRGMKVGGQRELIIPPALAYGSEGVYPSIPPNSTLVFLVELLDVK